MHQRKIGLGLAISSMSVLVLAMPVLAQQSTDPAAKAEAAAPQFELIEAGENPEERRYEFAVGQAVTLRMVNDVQMKMDMGFGLQGQPLPTSEQYITMRVVEVDDLGVASVQLVIDRARVTPGQEVDPFVRQAIEEGLAPYRGIRARFKLDPRGRTSDEVVTDADGMPLADPEIRQSMEETMKASGVALPVEPIGAGAVWIQRETISINGVTMLRESTHTVESIEGDSMVVISDVGVSAEPHFVENDMLAPGMRLRLDGTTMKGSGRSVFSLAGLETSFEVTTSGDVNMTVFQNGQEIEMRQWISMTISAESHEGPLPDADEDATDGPGL
ncbi:MAG: hypothetical protein RIE77_03650 [Phycisphaerales bacterium]